MAADGCEYVIAERTGAPLETVKHLMGPNRRPVGMPGAFCWFRHGANLVVPSAVRALRVNTTA